MTTEPETRSYLNLAAALALADAGFFVIPCRPTKHPYLKDWPNRGATTLAVIREWWTRWSDAIPGLPCGSNSLLVIDQDRHEGGADGVAAWRALCEQHGVDESGCLVVETPTTGRHTYFRQAFQRVGNSAGKIASGIDTRGDGGYVIGPGAVLPDGRAYRVLSGDLASTPNVPDGLCTFLAAGPKSEPAEPAPDGAGPTQAERPTGPPGARQLAYAAKVLREECARIEAAEKGQRNHTLNLSAFSFGTMIPHYGVGVDDALPLKAAARQAGLSDEEIERTFQSGITAGQCQPRPSLEDGNPTPRPPPARRSSRHEARL
jgi:hypothetical protein